MLRVQVRGDDESQDRCGPGNRRMGMPAVQEAVSFSAVAD